MVWLVDIITMKKGGDYYAWTPGGSLFTAVGGKLYKFTPGKDKDWRLLADFSVKGLSNITRLALDSKGQWLALVNSAFAFTLWNRTLRTLSATESSVINNTMLIQIAILLAGTVAALGALRALFDDPIPGIGYHLVTRPGPKRPALRTFMAWLKTTVTDEERALFRWPPDAD